MDIQCRPFNGQPVTVILNGNRRYYFSKAEARRKIAWHLLYASNRLDRKEDRFDYSYSYRGWARKRWECTCNEEQENPMTGHISRGVFSDSCSLHERKIGYYRRLHDRIVRWLKDGYILPNSGLADRGAA